jgi:hypothetical protein
MESQNLQATPSFDPDKLIREAASLGVWIERSFEYGDAGEEPVLLYDFSDYDRICLEIQEKKQAYRRSCIKKLKGSLNRI